MSRDVSRRALLRLIGVAPLGAVTLPGVARAQLFGQSGGRAAASSFRAVAVDVTPLLDHGGGASARLLAVALEAKMQGVFADRLTPGDKGAPLLTARITNLYFTEYSGTQDYAFGQNDNIEGDGILTGKGQVLSTTHVLTELPPSYSGAYYLENINRIRMDSIAYQFAYWLRREMGV